jgi:hypothetical protein
MSQLKLLTPVRILGLYRGLDGRLTIDEVPVSLTSGIKPSQMIVIGVDEGGSLQLLLPDILDAPVAVGPSWDRFDASLLPSEATSPGV